MATAKILKYGFKAKSERQAILYREKLNLNSHDPLSAFDLANHLNIPILKAQECMPNAIDVELLRKYGDECAWSAVSILTKKGNKIILHNPFNSAARQQSDLMHEIAHIICEHTVEQKHYDFIVPIGMRDYNEEQEEEAKCLGSALQLPITCLKWANRSGMTNEEIASHFNASLEMVRYRMNITGLAKRKYIKNVVG